MISSLLAGEQLAAAVLATLSAVFTSRLAPESISRSTYRDSRTPPEQDSTSAGSWCRKVRRSAARSPLVGRGDRPPAPATPGSPPPTPTTHGCARRGRH